MAEAMELGKAMHEMSDDEVRKIAEETSDYRRRRRAEAEMALRAELRAEIEPYAKGVMHGESGRPPLLTDEPEYHRGYKVGRERYCA